MDLWQEINKHLGRGVIVPASMLPSPSRRSTGIVTLDLALDGWQEGSIVELYGQYGTGKTTIALRSLALANKGLLVALEGCRVSLEWGSTLGVDWGKVDIAKPETLEEVDAILYPCVRSRNYDTIVVDSMTAIGGDGSVATMARKWNSIIRKVNAALQPLDMTKPETYNKTVVILLSHAYTDVSGYYSTETTSGGRAKSYLAGVRIHLTTAPKSDLIKDEDAIVGRKIHCIFVKEGWRGQEMEETFVNIIRRPTPKYPQEGICNLSMMRYLVQQVTGRKISIPSIAEDWEALWKEVFNAYWGREPTFISRR